jgi:hypothetical protein
VDFSLPAPHRPATFARLYSELALHQAVIKAYTRPLFSWRKALGRSHDGRTLYDFARHPERNIAALHRALATQSFRFREGMEIRWNFNGRERTVYLFPWEERIVDAWLYQSLNRRFHSAFSPNSFAYRHRSFGVDRCQRQIKQRLAALPRPVWFLKRDIANYFPSIDHQILLQALAAWIDPQDYLYELARQRVQFGIRDETQVRTAERGVPFGSAIACFFANLYLVPLDRALDDLPGLDWFRYADDLLVFSHDRDEVEEAGRRLEETLGALRLASKPGHHRDFVFSSGGEKTGSTAGFEPVTRFRHLGLEFRDDGTVGLSRDKARKIRNLFRFAWRRARRKFARCTDPIARAALAITIARRIVEEGFRSVAIIDYYLKHTDDERQWREIDRWLAEAVLALAFGNGHKKGNFRRLPFARLRELGLPSLVHRRRLLRHGHIRSSFFVLRVERLTGQQRGRLSSGERRESAAGFPPQPEAAAVKSS